MSSQPILVVIGVAIVVNLVIMVVLTAMIVARRHRSAPATATASASASPARYRYEMDDGRPTAVYAMGEMHDEPGGDQPIDLSASYDEPVGPERSGPAPVEPQVARAAATAAAAATAPLAAPGQDQITRVEAVIDGAFREPTDPGERPVDGGLAIAPPAPASPAPASPAPASPAAASPAPIASPRPAVPTDPDRLTGLDGPLAWDSRVREEDARFRRYRRPVSVVLFEVDGFDRFKGRLGADVANQILTPVGISIRSQARATDGVARIGERRFAVILPETDEVQAINFVERVRTECDRWLASGALSMRLAIGWSSPIPGTELGTALQLADERLDRDRRRVPIA